MTPSATDLSVCIRKKRKSVAKTLGKILGAGAAMLVACYALWLGLPTITAGAGTVASLVVAVSSTIAAALASVPWWCWVILGIVAILAFVLVVYPWAWCVSGEFVGVDEGDTLTVRWGSIILLTMIALISLMCQDVTRGVESISIQLLVITLICVSLTAIEGVLDEFHHHGPISFIPAYLHYRRRIAQEEKEG